MRNQNIGKNVGYLALRYLMITVFVFMCVPIVSLNSDVFGPILGVFYLFALIYFFWFTMKTEGEKDVNRVNIGQVSRFRWKGAVCALILAVPLMIVNIVPLFFPNPVKEAYRGYFTGTPVVLAQDAKFNQELRELSGKEGYIPEITFNTDQTISHIVYSTSAGVTVHCDGETEDENKAYYLEVTGEDGTVIRVYSKDSDLTEEQSAAFEECKYAVDDIKDVIGVAPNWQTLLNILKFIGMVALSHFCQLFTAGGTVAVSVCYCVCMLALCVAAQVGYEMGYRNIEFIRRKRPVKDSKAGDSVMIQRAHITENNEEK